MIYTLTINPAIDLTMHLSTSLKIGKVNRSIKDDISIGGKGINIATILNNLDEQVIPIVVVSGYTGKLIESYIIDNFNNYYLIEVQNGQSRLKINVQDTSETEINGNGPEIDKEDIDKIIDYLKDIKDEDYLCLTGSIPINMDNYLYANIIENLNNKPKIIVDADKELLFNTLKYKPFLIKPNLEELQAYFDVEIIEMKQIKQYLIKLKDLGAINVLCSLGKDGAILLDENNKFHYLDTIEGDVLNTIGSGDSMIAGFIYEYISNHDYEEALKMAIACGSATAFSPSLANKNKIIEVYNHLTNK